MSPRVPIEHSDLLSQVGWVRSLAHQIADDVHDASDIAQEALVVAMTGERPRENTLRQWLAGIVRGLSRTKRRADRRRAQREHAVRRVDCYPSAEELVESAARQRALVGAVLAQDEPYRATLLQRYFQELSNEEIAAREGVTPSAVATRLQRGRARVRAHLEARGGPENWLGAFVPLFRRGHSSKSAIALPLGSSTALLMTTTTKILLASCALLGVFALIENWSNPTSDHARVADAITRSDDVTSVDSIGAKVAAPGAISARQPATGDPETPPAIQSSRAFDPPPVASVVGRVVDLSSRAVANVQIERKWASVGAQRPGFELPHDRITSGADGTFTYVPVRGEMLVASSDVYATVLAGATRHGDRGPVVVVAPHVPIAGIVVDEAGDPVAGADVWKNTHARAFESLGGLTESTIGVQRHAVTDALGGFRIEGVGDSPAGYLMISAKGFPSQFHQLRRGGDRNLRIVLERGPNGATDVRGRVVFSDGAPASGAWVSAGGIAERADEDGRFHVDTSGPGVFATSTSAPVRILAVAEQRGAAELELPSIAERASWPKDIVLIIDDEFRRITGHVVDETGRPVKGARVRVADSTSMGMVPIAQGAQSFHRMSVEQLSGGAIDAVAMPPHAGATSQTEDGSFVVTGLLDRNYRLEASSRLGLLAKTSAPIRAGSRGVVLVLDRRLLGRIAGRLVDRTGVGVSGVTVAVARKKMSGEEHLGFDIGSSVVTDADGRFDLENIATTDVFLRLSGESIVPELHRALPERVDLESLELRVGRRCRVRFRWGEWLGRADTMHLVDDSDAELTPLILRGNSIAPMNEVRIGEGGSGLLAVPDLAATAVFYSAGEEVGRTPVRFSPGESQTYEF